MKRAGLYLGAGGVLFTAGFLAAVSLAARFIEETLVR